MYDCMHISLLCVNEYDLQYVCMLKYVEIVYCCRLYAWLFIIYITGGSCLSHTAVKLDSRLARIFVAKFLCIIKLIIITG